MNEAQTRLDLIDPTLKAAAWGVFDRGRIRVEVIAPCRILVAGKPCEQEKADYLLVYKKQIIEPLVQPRPKPQHRFST